MNIRSKVTYEIEYLVHELAKPIGSEEVIINCEACINSVLNSFKSYVLSIEKNGRQDGWDSQELLMRDILEGLD